MFWNNSIKVYALILILLPSLLFSAHLHFYPSGTDTALIPYSNYHICSDGENLTSIINNNVNSGEIIVFHTGTYKSISFTLTLDGILIKPGYPGGTIFTDTTQITISSDNTILRGIVFRNILYDDYEPVLKFDKADDCRVTNCKFIRVGYLNNPGEAQFFNPVVSLYESTDNFEIDSCHWYDSHSNSISVRWDPANGNLNTYPHIHDNLFESLTFGDTLNGNEAIMLGTARTGSEVYSMYATVENNLFLDCNSDEEIISVKSSGNTIRYNTFRQTGESNRPTSVTLRYGNSSQVYGNFFLNTVQGIRIFGRYHKVYNNYIQSQNYGIRFYGGRDSTYHPRPSYCYIYNNSIINTGEAGIRIGESTEFVKPGRIYVYNNLIYTENDGVIIEEVIDDDASNFLWAGNLFRAEGSVSLGDVPTSGYVTSDPVLSNALYVDGFYNPDTLYRPESTSAVIDSGIYISYITEDMDGQTRNVNSLDIGADEYLFTSVNNQPISKPFGTSYSIADSLYLPDSLNKSGRNIVENESLPAKYYLDNNYPNPFNPQTNISFEIPEKSIVSLKVYDVLGKEVAILISNKTFNPGIYTEQFDGSNLSSGAYFYMLKTGNICILKKMLLLK